MVDKFIFIQIYLFKHKILRATPQIVGIDEQIGKNLDFTPNAFYRREQ